MYVQLKETLERTRGRRPLSERLLASQTLCRIAAQAEMPWAGQWQQALINQYIGLGAILWATRLADEWHLNFEPWIEAETVYATEISNAKEPQCSSQHLGG